MSDTLNQPPFRPLAQKGPDIEVTRKDDGTVYLKQRHAPGDKPRSVPHALATRAAEHPDRIFLKQRDPQTDQWIELSYGQTKARVDSLAQAFLDLGAGPDAPVMILSGNSIKTAIAILAAQTIGAAAAPISVPYSTMSSDFGKLKHCFNAVKPVAVFAENLDIFKPALEALKPLGAFSVISDQGPGNDVLDFDTLAATSPTPKVAEAMDTLTDQSIGKYLFTSGSTGMPKPVPTTQGAMCWMIAGVEGLRDDARDPDYDPNEVANVLDWLPWNHISGSNVNFNTALWNGATFWIDGGKPTPELFGETIRNLRECKPLGFGTAPIALSMLAEEMEKDDSLRDAVFEKLRSIAYGGATLSDDLYNRLQSLAITATGKRIPIVTMYGATETQGITVVHWEVDRVGLIGLPLPGLTLKLAPTSGKLEVRVKGATVMPGYHNMPDKTAEVFDDEGFYCLGDAATFVDENDPAQGIVFDGRVGEDFKLSTGTWVSVGVLRPDVVAACSPLVFDAVIAGQDKNFIGALFWPSQAAIAEYAQKHNDDLPAALGALQGDLAEKIRAFNAKEGGSSRRIKRFTIMLEPPSIDVGEITDKGYVNQRAVIDNRAELVAALYSPTLSEGVVEV
ncbi:MAG: AMP-binding protein [Parvibaculaceae bacterium]|nr:AMP-binding protein [Parvibaculaceae bacterium]